MSKRQYDMHVTLLSIHYSRERHEHNKVNCFDDDNNNNNKMALCMSNCLDNIIHHINWANIIQIRRYFHSR